MALLFPKISKLIYESNSNEIWQYFGEEITLQNFQIVSMNPFLIETEGTTYLLTSDKNIEIDVAIEHVLLTTKKNRQEQI